MTNEEKYKEALERCKKEFNFNNLAYSHEEIKQRLERVFPELKESEDEKTRKGIIKYLEQSQFGEEHYQIDDDIVRDYIAWLEKQSEQKTVSKTEPIIEGLTTEFQKQVSHLIASVMDKEHEYDEDFVKWAANALLNYAKHELEKQDEHKCDCKYVGCHVNNMKRWCHKKQSEILYDKCNIKCSEYLKQGEQKCVWSEEDEKLLNSIIEDVMPCGECPDYPTDEKREYYYEGNRKVEFLKSLKERIQLIQPQPKQEWNEEDKKLIDDTFHLINTLASGYGEKVTEPITLSGTQMIASIKNRLRALVDNRPQNTWKPSDEQIEAVRIAAEIGTANNSWAMGVLKSIYQDLKKLKGE